MNFFEQATLRLKQQLLVSEDKQVAGALGFTDKAWSARKRRAAFPEKELYTLAAKQPDLGLDVQYVLTGITGEAQALLDARQAQMARAADAGLTYAQIRENSLAVDPASTDNLLSAAQRCRAPAVAALTALARQLAEPALAPDEDELLQAFRSADRASRLAIVKMARAMSAEKV